MNRKNFFRLSAAFFLLVVLPGYSCKSHSSSIVSTDEMTVRFSAVADGSGTTRVEARISTEGFDGDSTPSVRLNRRDVLRATRVDPTTGNEEEQEMVALGASSRIVYESIFAGDDTDTVIEIALDRESRARRDAPNSFISLPAPIELDWVDDPVALTPAPLNFSRSDTTPFFVVWDPFDEPDFDPGDELSFFVSGNCIRRYSGVIDWESGEDVLELTGGILEDRSAPFDGLSCALEVELTLHRQGVVDSGYESGRFDASQIRTLELLSTP